MKAEILFQFVVPLMFLAIWALTSLLNRDAQPLPPRPARPGARPFPPGQGMGQRPARIADSQRDRGTAREGTSSQVSDRRPTNAGSAAGYVVDGDMVFHDPATGRRAAPTPSGDSGAAGRGGLKPTRPAAAPNRKPTRGRRPTGAAPAFRPEPETPRALSDHVGRSMSLSRSRPLDLAPLSSNLTPLSAAAPSLAPARDLGLTRSAAGPAIVAREVRSMLGSPLKLRETMVLAEVLQPPLALRRPPRRGG